MKCISAIPLGVATKKTDQPEDKIPKEYGQQLSDAASELGLSDREVAKLAGYKPGPKTNDLTMHRLRIGDGAHRAAVKVYNALRDAGAKNLPPPTTPGLAPPKPPPLWREHWIELGEVLHEYMSEEKFNELVIKLREQARAHEMVSRGIASVARPLPWDAPMAGSANDKRESRRGDGSESDGRGGRSSGAREGTTPRVPR